jgi:copper transport protein
MEMSPPSVAAPRAVRPLPARPVRALLALVAAALVLVGPWASVAGAHASLVSVDPADGSRLDESPAQVRLVFSEAVSADLGGVQVVSAEGAQVQSGAVRVQGGEVEIDLEPDLPDGTYVISYRVISADGHPVRGGSVFGVGAAEVDVGALGRVTSGNEDRTWDIVGAVGRFLAYGGSLLAAGGALFLSLVHRGGAERPLLVRVVRGAAAVGAVGVLIALPVQAALGTGQGPGALFDDGVLSEVGADGVGAGVALALAGLLVLSVALELSRSLAIAGALVAAGSFAASGHTRAGDLSAAATLSDLSHLVVVAAWGGGLVCLALALLARRRQGDDDGTAPLVARFSSLATAGVLVAGATGAFLGWNEVRTLDGLTGTGYGLLLLAWRLQPLPSRAGARARAEQGGPGAAPHERLYGGALRGRHRGGHRGAGGRHPGQERVLPRNRRGDRAAGRGRIGPDHGRTRTRWSQPGPPLPVRPGRASR